MAYDRKKFDEQLMREVDAQMAGADAEGARLGKLLSGDNYVQREPIAGMASDGGWLYTNEQRLAYYRSHGLDRCDDYPGGDAQFEEDVLSGEFHANEWSDDPLKREDEYIVKCMYNGRFRFGIDFRDYTRHACVRSAFRANSERNGIVIHHTRHPSFRKLLRKLP